LALWCGDINFRFKKKNKLRERRAGELQSEAKILDFVVSAPVYNSNTISHAWGWKAPLNKP
jgi:hypothetical protein